MISRRRLRRVERRVMLKITERLVIQGCPSSGSEPDIAVGHRQPPGEACGLQSPRAQLRARTHGEIGSRGCIEPACLPAGYRLTIRDDGETNSVSHNDMAKVEQVPNELM
jgi:hypothetical protein